MSLHNSPEVEYPRPTIVCLCGSTKFKAQYEEVNYLETMQGRIVLSVGFFAHADAYRPAVTPDQKDALDNLHFRKIDLADEVFILNVQGYIGESTAREIEYAMRKGKTIRFLEPQPATTPHPPPYPPGV